MTNRRYAPITDNEEARVLIAIAQFRCEGCRYAWRLDLRRGDGFQHGEPKPIVCTARVERQALRNIAARARRVQK